MVCISVYNLRQIHSTEMEPSSASVSDPLDATSGKRRPLGTGFGNFSGPARRTARKLHCKGQHKESKMSGDAHRCFGLSTGKAILKLLQDMCRENMIGDRDHA